MANKLNNQNGFTIIELLISTAILSTMLVMAAFIMINLGNLYYKGINQAKIQNNVRNVVDELTDKLALTGAVDVTQATSLDGKTKAYCINTVRYVYKLGAQLKENPDTSDVANPQSRHVLWRDSATPATCRPANGFLDAAIPSVGGTELMGLNSRLTVFDITLSSPYNLKVGAAYGDADLLLGSVTTGSDVKCNGGKDTQFCAVSLLDTTVAQRLR